MMKPNTSDIFGKLKLAGKIARPMAVLLALILSGCATNNTIAERRKANAEVYASFSPEIKSLVDAGQIKAGMTTNAVYIAWGPPAEVLQSGNKSGVLITWVYRGGFLEETRYWAGRREPFIVNYYEPRTYIRAEIVFADGRVQSWRTLPQPGN